MDPQKVADEFLKENVYGDAYINNNDNESDNKPTVLPGAASALPGPAPALVSSVYPSPIPMITPLKTKQSSSFKATTSSKSLSGPIISPSPKKIRRSSLVDPKQLSFISEES